MDIIATTIQHVCAAFPVTPAEIFGTDRTERTTFPRQITIWIARQHGMRPEAIAEAMAGRKVPTILHATKRVQDRIDTEPRTKDLIFKLRAAIFQELARGALPEK